MPFAQIGRGLDDLVQFAQGVFYVAANGQIHPFDFVDFRGVDVDVDELRPVREFRDLAGHPIVEAHAQGQKQVGVIDRVIGVNAAVHAQHVQGQGVIAGESAQAHDRGGHGNAGLADQFEEFLAGVGRDYAASGINDRALGIADPGGDFFDFLGLGPFVSHVIARQLHGIVVVGRGLLELDVFGQIDQHRSWPAGRGHVKGLANHAGDVVDVGHQVMMFCDAAADFDDGRFLKGVGADHRRADLPGNGQNRNAVELGVGQRGDQVRRSRPAGGHANADPPGAAGVTLGGKTAALFMPGQDHANLIAKPGQGLMQGHACPAGIGENRIHAMIYQGLHDYIGPAGDLGLFELDWMETGRRRRLVF